MSQIDAVQTHTNTGYRYNHQQLTVVMDAVIRQNLSADAAKWFFEKLALVVQDENKLQQLSIAFAAMPRKTGKATVVLSGEQQQQLAAIRPGFSIAGWSIDRLCRVRLLLQLDASDQESYTRSIEQLFPAGEMNELVALYSALPLLAYPEAWRLRCSEGIRSNIGDVLEAIICNNPYPSENLPEAAWNQLVLKAFFTDKPIHKIIGLDERANKALADTLTDYAHERWAAHRPVHPQLWRCVGPFINEQNFADLQRVFQSENTAEREAAALACAHSNYPPAQELLQQHSELKALIESGGLTWDLLAERTTNNL